MGTTNNLKDIIFTSDIQQKKATCATCNQLIGDTKWVLEFRTNHDTNWAEFKEGANRGWIGVEIELYHENCDDIKVLNQEGKKQRWENKYTKN